MRIVFIFIVFLCCALSTFSQNDSKKHATIRYAGDKSKHTRTYIGIVKQGDPARLKNELRQSSNYNGNVATVHGNREPDMNAYINYMSRNRKASERKKFRHLSDIYDIDEEKLEEGNPRYFQKYLDEKERVFTEEKRSEKGKRRNKKSDVMNFSEFRQSQQSPPQTNTYLARNYKIKGKRLRPWKKLKYPPGSVSIVIKYEIRDRNSIRTYVDVVDGHLSPGSHYKLKYHGNNSKRKYYLEYQNRN